MMTTARKVSLPLSSSLGSLSRLRSAMATATKTSLVNKHLGNGDYFVIIASSSHPLLMTERAANGQVEAL